MKLVFVHGSGMNGVAWQYQQAHFINSEALDLPGHPEGKLSEKLEEYVDYVNSYLSQQEEEVVLVGHSLGSAVLLKLAQSFKEPLRAMVLIGSGARLRVMPMLLDALAKSAEQDNSLPPALLSMNDAIAEPLSSKINSVMEENGARVMLNDLRICDRFDVMDDLANITLPVLVLTGEKDQMTPPKYADYLAANLPNARMEIVKGGSHMVFAEQAERVNEIIERFISSLK